MTLKAGVAAGNDGGSNRGLAEYVGVGRLRVSSTERHGAHGTHGNGRHELKREAGLVLRVAIDLRFFIDFHVRAHKFVGFQARQNRSAAHAVMDLTIDVKAALLKWGGLPMFSLSLLTTASLP